MNGSILLRWSNMIGTKAPFDESLLELTLAMTPEERLLLNDRTIQVIEELRRGFVELLDGRAALRRLRGDGG